ncbi:MAG: hypothetical protein JSS56_26605 [Proteobacteria bacterium]|nr:hypothetical protein [Pseudomonadota bacterium]
MDAIERTPWLEVSQSRKFERAEGPLQAAFRCLPVQLPDMFAACPFVPNLLPAATAGKAARATIVSSTKTTTKIKG